MIVDIISLVLLSTILGVLLYLVLKRSAFIEKRQAIPTRQEVLDPLPKEVSDFDAIREAFIEYIERESNILRLDNFGAKAFIGYESGYRKVNGYRQIWLAAWLPEDRNDIAAVISIQSNTIFFKSHYQKFKEHKGRIEDIFSFEYIKLIKAGPNISQVRVVKKGIDLTQRANWDTGFRWLRETLEKLYYVLRVHDILEWGPPTSSEPFDYKAVWWKTLSQWYKEQKAWRCEECNLSLHQDKYYLHTHHILGPRFSNPEDLIALCIGCHSEQPGHHHLKKEPDYWGFITRYGEKWKRLRQ